MNLVKSFALIILITMVIVSFQNCSPSKNTGLLGSKTSAASIVDTINKDAPFAYDLVADTISYNSCIGSELNQSGVHGIKIGANEGYYDTNGNGTLRSGLKLRTDFLQYIGQAVKPIFPSTVITPAQIQYVLQNSTSNQDARIQFAVRKKTDLSIVKDVIDSSKNATFSSPRDGYVELAPLSSDPVLTDLTKSIQFSENGSVLSEGARITNLYGKSDPRSIEISFGYSNYADETYSAVPDGTGSSTNTEPYGFGEAYSDRVRQKFNSGGIDKIILAVTYGSGSAGSTESSLSEPLRKDSNSTDKTKAYGRGYAFRFEAASTKAGWRSNLLKQVTETNLIDGSTVSGASWTCENFLILKQNQWNNANPTEPSCAPLTSTDLENATVSAQVKRLRRHYSEANWNIGLYYPKNSIYVPAARATQSLCLVPKQSECYLPTTNIVSGTDIGVNYDTNTECYLYAYSVMGVSYTGNPDITTLRKYGRCAQYASMCVRNSTNY